MRRRSFLRRITHTHIQSPISVPSDEGQYIGRVHNANIVKARLQDKRCYLVLLVVRLASILAEANWQLSLPCRSTPKKKVLLCPLGLYINRKLGGIQSEDRNPRYQEFRSNSICRPAGEIIQNVRLNIKVGKLLKLAAYVILQI